MKRRTISEFILRRDPYIASAHIHISVNASQTVFGLPIGNVNSLRATRCQSLFIAKVSIVSGTIFANSARRMMEAQGVGFAISGPSAMTIVGKPKSRQPRIQCQTTSDHIPSAPDVYPSILTSPRLQSQDFTSIALPNQTSIT